MKKILALVLAAMMLLTCCGIAAAEDVPEEYPEVIEGLDFNGKKVLPIMTHEGSGMGRSEADLKAHISGAIFAKGLAIHGADAKDSRQKVIDWVRKHI